MLLRINSTIPDRGHSSYKGLHLIYVTWGHGMHSQPWGHLNLPSKVNLRHHLASQTGLLPYNVIVILHFSEYIHIYRIYLKLIFQEILDIHEHISKDADFS